MSHTPQVTRHESHAAGHKHPGGSVSVCLSVPVPVSASVSISISVSVSVSLICRSLPVLPPRSPPRFPRTAPPADASAHAPHLWSVFWGMSFAFLS
jgi:hypothetical protein